MLDLRARRLPRARTSHVDDCAQGDHADGQDKGKRPQNVVREIVYGMSLGLFTGYL
jgi:hypothetical protein